MKVITLVVTALLAAVLAPASAHAAEPTRVMLLGDSVSHGLSGAYTWRYFAWKSLEGSGVDFVGPHRGTWSEADEFGGEYADPDFDQDHAARYGLSMWETLYWHNAVSAPPVADLMAYEPDVLVNTLGVNDLVGMNQTPEQAIDHSRQIIAQARAANPDVDVVLGALPQVWFERVPIYNDLLPALAAELSTEESRVVVTPVAALVNRVDTFDDAHPTTSGEVKIAASVVAGLAKLGIEAPEPVAAPPSATPAPTVEPTFVAPGAPVVVTPRAPRWVRAVRNHRRAVVKWGRVATSAYEVKCGAKSKVVSRNRVALRTSARRCKVRAVTVGVASPWVATPVKRRR